MCPLHQSANCLLHVLTCQVLLWFPVHTCHDLYACGLVLLQLFPNAECGKCQTNPNVTLTYIDMILVQNVQNFGCNPDGQTLCCCVLFERFWAVFPANAALAKATPWAGWIVSMMAVHLGVSNESGTN